MSTEAARVHTGIKDIVVGVDASPESVAALEWAISMARVTGAEVTAIMAWVPAMAFGYVDVGDWRESQERALIDVVKLAEPDDVTVNVRFVDGSAAGVLVEASRHADLLVVGSRGRGAVAGLLLGSVSTHCVRHALCPVAVLP